MDLVADRTRTVNRLRAQLTGIFPGLERALDLTNTGPLILLTGCQTPAALRRIGRKRREGGACRVLGVPAVCCRVMALVLRR
jgi:hypothetical protein